MTTRAARIHELIDRGHTRQQIADDLGIKVTALKVWAGRRHITLPGERHNPDRPMCKTCNRRHVVRSKNGPATHGLCPTCRAAQMGHICTREGCDQGATHGGRCSSHRIRVEVRVTTVTQYAFAFQRWTRYGTVGPSDGAKLEDYAWCCTCERGGKADDRGHAQRWVDRHNLAHHPEQVAA